MNIEDAKRNVTKIFRDVISVFLYLNIPGTWATFAFIFYFAMPIHILFLKGNPEKYWIAYFWKSTLEF